MFVCLFVCLFVGGWGGAPLFRDRERAIIGTTSQPPPSVLPLLPHHQQRPQLETINTHSARCPCCSAAYWVGYRFSSQPSQPSQPSKSHEMRPLSPPLTVFERGHCHCCHSHCRRRQWYTCAKSINVTTIFV